MLDESILIDVLTKKLIVIAKQPNLRNRYTVTYVNGDGFDTTLSFSKSRPPMSFIEQYYLARCYLNELDRLLSKHEYDAPAITQTFQKVTEYMQQPFSDECYRGLRIDLLHCCLKIANHYDNKQDITTYQNEYQELLRSNPKPFRAKKGSFDYWYSKAEKHDWYAMIIVSLCYRDGRLVIANDRLSNCWYKLAKSTYNYYNPNGKPFEEEYIEIESEITTDDSNGSSTN